MYTLYVSIYVTKHAIVNVRRPVNIVNSYEFCCGFDMSLYGYKCDKVYHIMNI